MTHPQGPAGTGSGGASGTGPKASDGLVHIPFRGEEVLAVDMDGRPFIVLRPALDNIGLDYSTQLKKLQGRSWATVGQCPTVGADGRVREMVTVDVRTFLMLLATVNESSVSDAIRPALIAYQREVSDAIEAYWTRGGAINPRSPLAAPRTLTLDETCALLRQQYGLSYTVVDLTRALRSAGVLRQSGGPVKEHWQLFWFTGSTWNVVFDFVDELVKRLGRIEGRVQERLDHGIQLELELTSAAPRGGDLMTRDPKRPMPPVDAPPPAH